MFYMRELQSIPLRAGITKRDGTKFVPRSLRPGTGRDDSEFDRDGTGRDDSKLTGTGRNDSETGRDGTGTGRVPNDIL